MKILVSEPLSEAGLEILRAEAEVDVRTGLTAEELEQIIGEYDALIVRSATKVNRALLEAGGRLKVVGRAGVGVDNIDLGAASQFGILVVNAPSGNTIAAAEHTMGMLLGLARHIPAAVASLKAGKWEKSKFMGNELYGRTLGVVGFGRIGQEVAHRAIACGMDILAYDPYLTPGQATRGAQVVTLDELLERSDVITLHTPKVKTPILGENEFKKTKPGLWVINCARGGLIDEAALLKAIEEKRVAGAALDVFLVEPPVGNPLLERPEVIGTPHLGASTEEAQEQVATAVAAAVLDGLAGKATPVAVNLPTLPPEEFEAEKPRLILARHLGRFLAQIHPGAMAEIRLGLEEEGGQVRGRLLANSVLEGLLGAILTERVNLVNAALLAESRGIVVVEERTRGQGAVLRVVLKGGGAVTSVAGFVTGTGESRLTEVNGYSLEAAFTNWMVYAEHRDQPGIIGQVGQILGNRGINIAGMQVGRQTRGGLAVMLMEVDEAVDQATQENLAQLTGISRIRVVSFGNGRTEEE